MQGKFHFTRARLTAVLVLITGSLIGVTAYAVDVTGSLRVGEGYAERAARARATPRRTYYWEEWNGLVDPRPASIDMSREVAAVLLGNAPAPPPRVTLEWRGGALFPSTLVVRTGSILVIENHDNVTHELESPGLISIAAERTGPGTTRTSLELREAGSYPLRDRAVPHATGHLHVLANLAAVSRPNADGSFTFAGVAPGQYVLKIFHGANELSSTVLEVVEGPAITVDPITLAAR